MEEDIQTPLLFRFHLNLSHFEESAYLCKLLLPLSILKFDLLERNIQKDQDSSNF